MSVRSDFTDAAGSPDQVLIGRLRSALDELTAPEASISTGSATAARGASHHIDVPAISAPVMPLEIARSRRWATVGAGLLTAAAVAGFVVIATRPPSPTGVGSQSIPAVPTTAEGVDLDRLLPTFEFATADYRPATAPVAQSSGTGTDPFTVFGTPGDVSRTVRVMSIPGFAEPDGVVPNRPPADDFAGSQIVPPRGRLREFRWADAGVGGLVELVWEAPDQPMAYVRAAGLNDDELTVLLAALRARPDGTWELLGHPELDLVDAGPSAFEGGQFWHLRYADYVGPHDVAVRVSVSSGSIADLLSDEMLSTTRSDERSIGSRKVWVRLVEYSEQAGVVNDRWRAVWMEGGARIEVLAGSTIESLDAAVDALIVRPVVAG